MSALYLEERKRRNSLECTRGVGIELIMFLLIWLGVMSNRLQCLLEPMFRILFCSCYRMLVFLDIKNFCVYYAFACSALRLGALCTRLNSCSGKPRSVFLICSTAHMYIFGLGDFIQTCEQEVEPLILHEKANHV